MDMDIAEDSSISITELKVFLADVQAGRERLIQEALEKKLGCPVTVELEGVHYHLLIAKVVVFSKNFEQNNRIPQPNPIVKPVSYTHLDVYKRQGRSRALFDGPADGRRRFRPDLFPAQASGLQGRDGGRKRYSGDERHVFSQDQRWLSDMD